MCLAQTIRCFIDFASAMKVLPIAHKYAREAKSPRYAFKISLSYRSLSIESNGLYR